MGNDQRMQHGDYEYYLVSYKKANGMYQGIILLTAHAGKQYSSIIEIPTPSAFKTERAAWIEASALACQLIETGAMSALVPQGGQATLWPLESEELL